MSYLDRLKGVNSEKCLPHELQKVPRDPFCSFCSAPSTHFLKTEAVQTDPVEVPAPAPSAPKTDKADRPKDTGATIPAWCRGVDCFRFENLGPTAGPGCLLDGDTWRPLRNMVGCPAKQQPLSRVVRATETKEVPRANIAIGMPCGRCRGKLYAPAPGGFAWPDGSRGDGWRCQSCGQVYLLSGEAMERQQTEEKITDLFRRLPEGRIVKVQED